MTLPHTIFCQGWTGITGRFKTEYGMRKGIPGLYRIQMQREYLKASPGIVEDELLKRCLSICRAHEGVVFFLGDIDPPEEIFL